MTEIIRMTITELAKREGITKQAMHKKVHRLAENHKGLLEKRGRKSMVDVALYEIAIASDGDPAKEIGRESRALLQGGHNDHHEPQNNGYRDAQTERALIDVRIKALELAKLEGELVPVNGPHGIQAAMDQVANLILRRIELIPDIANRLHHHGLITDQAAVRRIFRDQTDDLRRKICADMRTLLLQTRENGVSMDSEFDS